VRLTGVECQGAANPFFRRRLVTTQVVQQPERVDRVGVPRVSFQDPPVERLGLCEPSSPVMRIGFS
jgi:hypothetical protein